jgi:DnaJ-class molecular chaperone
MTKKCEICNGDGYVLSDHAPKTPDKDMIFNHIRCTETTWLERCEKCGGLGYIEEK